MWTMAAIAQASTHGEDAADKNSATASESVENPSTYYGHLMHCDWGTELLETGAHQGPSRETRVICLTKSQLYLCIHVFYTPRYVGRVQRIGSAKRYWVFRWAVLQRRSEPGDRCQCWLFRRSGGAPIRPVHRGSAPELSFGRRLTPQCSPLATHSPRL